MRLFGINALRVHFGIVFLALLCCWGVHTIAAQPLLNPGFDPTISLLINNVSDDSLLHWWNQFTGAESVRVAGEDGLITSRYVWTDTYRKSVRWLVDRLENMGYSPAVDSVPANVQCWDEDYDPVSRRGLCACAAGAFTFTFGDSGVVVRPNNLEMFNYGSVGNVDFASDGSAWLSFYSYATYYIQLYRSLDGGLTWEMRSERADGIGEIFALDSTRVFISTGTSLVCFSDDGGFSWSVSTPLRDYITSLSFWSADSGMVTGRGIIGFTADGGHSFTLVTDALDSIWYEGGSRGLDGRYWAFGDYGYLGYADRFGGSFTTVPTSPPLGTLISMKWSSRFGMVTGGRGILWTADSGRTWNGLVMPVVTGSLRQPWLVGDDFMFFSYLGQCFRTDLAVSTVNELQIEVPHWPQVFVDIPGRVTPDSAWVVSAHLDAMSEDPWNLVPGADDNASGSMALLLLADALRGVPLRRTVRLAWFTAEELGLLGSYWMNYHRDTLAFTVMADINADMISYGPPIQHMLITGGYDSVTNDLTDSLAALGFRWLPELSPYYTYSPSFGSDHAPFWAFGTPAVMISDNDFPDFYHTTRDVVANNNPDWLLLSTKFLAGAVAAGAQVINSVHGYVRSASTGEPVRNVPITMFSGSTPVRTVQSDRFGNWASGYLDPGIYRLEVNTEECAPFTRDFEVTADEDRAVNLQLPCPDATPHVYLLTCYADDDNSGESHGNNDGRIGRNETVEFWLTYGSSYQVPLTSMRVTSSLLVADSLLVFPRGSVEMPVLDSACEVTTAPPILLQAASRFRSTTSFAIVFNITGLPSPESDTVWFNTSDIPAVPDISPEARIVCWPNPAKDFVRFLVPIESPGNGSVEVLDAQGREIARLFTGWTVQSCLSLNWTLNGTVASGTYIVKSEFNGRLQTEKVMVIGR